MNAAMNQQSDDAPLKGLRVIEFGQYIAAPAAAQMRRTWAQTSLNGP